MKKNNLQIFIGSLLAAILTFGQMVQADPVVTPKLIIDDSQMIRMDTDTGVVIVGNSGTDPDTDGNGFLTVQAGATLANYLSTSPDTINGEQYLGNNSYLGFNKNSTGIVTVTGENTFWDNSSGDLYAGYKGQGILTVKDHGRISSDNLYVGYDGTGELKVENGGIVSSSDGFVGINGGSYSRATISGTDSLWDNINLYVGGSTPNATDQGELIINDGGVVSAFENATIWPTGSLSGNNGILDGNVNNYGLISPGNSDNSAGVLTVTGDLVLKNTSRLTFEIFGPTQHDQLLVDGDFIIGGLLELDFDSFIQPVFETTYDVIYIGGDLINTWDNFSLNISPGFDSNLLNYSIVESDHTSYTQILRLIVAGVDNSENSIPEPTSLLLLGLGSIMLQWQQRRSQRA